jgi:hypothetical protein
VGFVSLLTNVGNLHAAIEGALPPRAQWHASSSSVETPAMAAAFAIDGDTATRWGGGFSPGNWFQVDLGRAASVGGVLIRWDSGAARAYSIEDSIDGRKWHTAFKTSDATAGTEYIFFPAVEARYVRLASPARTADWGISMFEFEPLAQRDAPRISGATPAADAAALWLGGQARSLDKLDRKSGARQLDIELPRALAVAGLEIFWKHPPRGVRLESRDSGGKWQLLADDPLAPVKLSFIAAPEAHNASALRLSVQPADDGSMPVIERLRLLSPTRVLSPMKRYEIAATRQFGALMPASLRQNQVYWTAVGVQAGRQKSVFDEYGDVEAFKGAPLVQPIWRDASGHAAAAFEAQLTHRLRDGWMPLPGVQWSPQPGLQLISEAIAIGQSGAPVTIVRHRLLNTGDKIIEGQLALVTRPMQISPPWQNGGLSAIRDVVVDTAGASVRINDRVLFESLTPIDAAGAAAFGQHGEEEITRFAATGALPERVSAHDDDGLAAALVSYKVRLAPGAHRDIVIAFALGNERIDPAAPLPAAPPIERAQLLGTDHDAGAAFDRLADQVAGQWQERVAKIGLTLPDQSLVDMLRAQAAYMLINQAGPAMQPGPRNYNRSFIRDGAATAAALLRMGMAKTARDYLHWYAEHAVHDSGLVSPILNDDGTVNKGFGSDIEYDSQGEFIWLIAEIARLDGGAASVREYEPKVRLALKFLQELRERTLVRAYMAEREAPARFRGIIAPSISHEGYSTPTHSYWDDYWALKGWHDGAWLAEAWGDRDTAKWAREQYAALHESVAASIRATMQWKGSDVIPASADLGDPDPTGLSIALDPCGVQDLFPADALQRTFARYLDDVRKRDAPDALYAYTPYEMRNVLSFAHLDEPQQADELLMNLMRHRRPPEWQVLAEVVYSDLRHAIYLGDMPHTWIGSEYARSIFGMLMREGDERMQLLPGTPESWLQGPGLSVRELPVAYGKLSMAARQDGNSLRVTLGPGLDKDTALELNWPNRKRPARVTIDGRTVADYTSDGIAIARPFNELTAQW